MNKQLIFLVETNKKCQSDWMYIKSTLDCFYGMRSDIHYEVIYLDGKSKYNQKEKQISKLKSRFTNGESYVFLCIDLDHYQSNPKDHELNEKIQNYCSIHHYEFIWFNRNIEHVYMNQEAVESKKKRELAERFKRKNMIKDIAKDKLISDKVVAGKSNILLITEKYFK